MSTLYTRLLSLTFFTLSSCSLYSMEFASQPSAVCSLVTHVKENKATYTLLLFTALIMKLIYEGKERPKDVDLTMPGAQDRRWREIVNSDEGIAHQLSLLADYISDFYLFGRRPKAEEVVISTSDEYGHPMKIKQKKIFIKGYGWMAFLHDKVFDKLESLLKTGANIAAVVLALDALHSSGKIPGSK